MIGVPPPEGMERSQWASWYWDCIQEAAAEHDEKVSPLSECILIQDLITGAIESGVIGHSIPVAGFSEPQPLHSLVAPYRTVPGGAAEREHAERRRVLDRPVPRRYRRERPESIWPEGLGSA